MAEIRQPPDAHSSFPAGGTQDSTNMDSTVPTTAPATDDGQTFSGEEPQKVEEDFSGALIEGPDADDGSAALAEHQHEALNEAEAARAAIERAADAEPADYSKPMRLSDFGDDLKDIPPSFVKLSAKPTTLRILHRLPVPKGYEANNAEGKIPILARFKVQYHGTLEERIWDVSSKKALALLSGLDNLRDWFWVTRTGQGSGTSYEIKQGVAQGRRGA